MSDIPRFPRPTLFGWAIGTAVSALLAFGAGWLIPFQGALPVHWEIPGALLVDFQVPLFSIWMPLASMTFNTTITVLRWLFTPAYICHVCANRLEPLNQVDYWRGHGAHIWHLGGN